MDFPPGFIWLYSDFLGDCRESPAHSHARWYAGCFAALGFFLSGKDLLHFHYSDRLLDGLEIEEPLIAVPIIRIVAVVVVVRLVVAVVAVRFIIVVIIITI